MTYELIGYNTDSRYRDDIRHREYTTSEKKALLFGQIPKIQFTDSGHGVVFAALEHKGPRRSVRRMDYVREQLEILKTQHATPKPVKRENKADKGTRLLIQGRLTVTKVAGDLVVAECKGDSGEVYELGFSNGHWFCGCLARTDCSHLSALWRCTVRPR